MIKVVIKGEAFSFDNERYSMSEAIAIEEGLGLPFHEWKTSLYAGSVKALAGLVWLVLKRAGRDTTLKDIISGAYDLSEDDIAVEREGGPDPTDPPSPAPEGSTSEPSPSASGSAPGSGSESP